MVCRVKVTKSDMLSEMIVKVGIHFQLLTVSDYQHIQIEIVLT